MPKTPCLPAACSRCVPPRITAPSKWKSPIPVSASSVKISRASSIPSSPPKPPVAAPVWDSPLAMASSRSTPARSRCAPLPAKAPLSAWNSRPQGKRFMPNGSILVIDDEAEIREGLELLLSSEGYTVTSAETGQSGLARLGEEPYDLLLLDVSLPDGNRLDLLRDIPQRDPHLPIVLITAYGSIDMARQAFKSAAQDYITKPWSNDELLAQVALAVEGRRLREENVQLKRAFKQRYNFPNIIGKSEPIVSLLDLVTQVAPSRSTILIVGESGTGKELIAKAIHSASPRADKPFVAVNSGSIPVDLLESQIFAHVKS